jgi:hypothetical protein
MDYNKSVKDFWGSRDSEGWWDFGLEECGSRLPVKPTLLILMLKLRQAKGFNLPGSIATVW